MSKIIVNQLANEPNTAGPAFLVGVDSLEIRQSPIMKHKNTVAETLTIASDENAMSVGEITVKDGGEIIVDGELVIL